jgi:hypothetical protein
MHRRSYFPTNQQLVSQITATSSGVGVDASRPVTPSVHGGHELQSVHAMVPEGYSETERFGQGVPLADMAAFNEKQQYRP